MIIYLFIHLSQIFQDLLLEGACAVTEILRSVHEGVIIKTRSNVWQKGAGMARGGGVTEVRFGMGLYSFYDRSLIYGYSSCKVISKGIFLHLSGFIGKHFRFFPDLWISLSASFSYLWVVLCAVNGTMAFNASLKLEFLDPSDGLVKQSSHCRKQCKQQYFPSPSNFMQHHQANFM